MLAGVMPPGLQETELLCPWIVTDGGNALSSLGSRSISEFINRTGI
jgi:hypothetical protein